LYQVSPSPRCTGTYTDDHAIKAPPLELSQDPISQVSEGESVERDREVPLARIKIPKGFGKVDIALFRMPDRPRSRSTFAQITAYSDGFSGKEREPTGRLMPLRQPSRRKESCQNFTIRYGQLALVSERPSEEALEEPRRQKKSKKPKTINPKPVVQQYKEEQETLVRVTTVDQYMASTEAVVQPQTPVLADQSLLSSTPAGNTSPTKRKSQTLRLDHRLSQQLQPRTISQRTAVRDERQQGIEQPPSTVPTLAKSRTERQMRNEEIASQEISLVTMKRLSQNCRNEEERGFDCQDMVGDGDNGEDGSVEYETNKTPSEDEEEDERGDSESHDPAPDTGAENLLQEDDGDETEGNLNDPASEPSSPNLSEDDETDVIQVPSGTQLQLCGTAMAQAQQREIDSLVAELKEQTKSEKARIREKLHALLSSQGMRTRSPVKIQKQELHSSQQLPTLARIASEALLIEPRSSQRSLHSINDFDSSWRPRIPDTSGSDMQVDEEIVDSPTPPRELEGAASSRRESLRRRSSIRSQPLHVVDQLPESASFEMPPAVTHDSQGGSIILGDTRNFRRSYPADIPETQVDEEEEIETQVVKVPNGSYFSQASQRLSQPLRPSIVNRTISTPIRARSRVHFNLHQNDDSNGLMAGGISMSAAFRHTVSPVKSSPNRQSSQVQTPSQPRTLKELTRSASQGLGTLHGSARKRTVSLPFKPPFKQPLQASQG